MNSLLSNKEQIFEIIEKVNNLNTNLFEHKIISNGELNNNTISIVMTSSDRSKQTYFTLSTISKSQYKNIQIILVDDSTIDPIMEDELVKYNFYIDFIKINKKNKNWHNPLVNYNIGFKFIKGNKIIIQNAEVCHIGDVINFINKELRDNNYFVFDVKAVNSHESNEIIYNLDISTNDIYKNENLFKMWYQHKSYNRNLHFLVSLTSETFKKIKNFSYDYTMGTFYDDDDFLLKIKYNKIMIQNIDNEIFKIGGIHLYHVLSTDSWDVNKEDNISIFNKKLNYYNNFNNYIDVTLEKDNFYFEYNKLQRTINKILLFGSTGMLGNYIFNYFNDKIKIININYRVSNENLNILEEILKNNNVNENTCVINCIGLIPQRHNNNNNKDYFLVNSIFPQVLWNICKRYNAKMIQPTTDCVFNGLRNGGDYVETDIHDEVSDYGISKSLGEPCGCTVIRTSIIGKELQNKKSFLEWVLNSMEEKKIINGWTNHMWNGITCLEYCKVIEIIINNNMFWSGVKHIYSPSPKSKYELAYTIIKTFYNYDEKTINEILLQKEDIKNINKTLKSNYEKIFNIKELNEQIEDLKIFNF